VKSRLGLWLYRLAISLEPAIPFAIAEQARMETLRAQHSQHLAGHLAEVALAEYQHQVAAIAQSN